MQKAKTEHKTDRKDLDSIMAAINKEFGAGAVMSFTGAAVQKVPTISTGSVGLDMALGCGGLPRGRIVEVYGPESSGKTTLTLHVISEAQKAGLTCSFIDAEHALDVSYAQALGVDVESLLISQPDTGEQALEIADRLISSEAVHVVIVDSVAALVPKAELEGDMGDSHMGLQARLMSQAMRKLTGNVSRTGALLIFINQTRSKIGVFFGSNETTTGGNALKFYASVRVDIRRIGAIKQGDNSIGNRTRVRVVKNKLAPPFKETEFDILYGKGISKSGELVDMGVANGAIEKAGAWFSFEGERLGQGRPNVVTLLDTDIVLRDRVEAKVRSGTLPGKAPKAEDASEEDDL